MKSSRLFRSPFTWIVLGFVAIALIFEAVGNIGGYVEKPTSDIVALINSNTPLAEVVLTDGEQAIKVTTKENPPRKLRSTWVESQSAALVERLNARVAEGTLDTWKGEPAQPNFWTTFLFSILPFLIIDLVVASVLMSMGMMMLPPVVVSLPFKLIFFVLVDGWSLVAGSLVQSYGSG